MTKDSVIETSGKILEVLPDSRYRVELESGHVILGFLSGRMKQNHISVTMGDQVTIELTPYDLTRGRIVRRLNTSSQNKPSFRR